MRKMKFIALSLVVAVMLLGAGYAAWTDTLNINTEVKTGQLDMHFVDLGEATELEMAPYVTGDVGYATHEEDGQVEQNAWDVANVKFGNLYPGATAHVQLKMQNNSTIPVHMNPMTDVKSANWGANGVNFNQIGACVQYFDKDGKALERFHSDEGNITAYANPWAPNQLLEAELPVGGYAIISFDFTAADTIDELETYTFSPVITFKQFNK